MAKFCKTCGTTIKAGENKCYVCGSKVKEGIKNQEEMKNENNNPGKSKIIAGLLAIFFGAFGAHDFYIGKIFSGMFKLFLALILPIWGVIILAIIGIIDGIGILSGKVDINNPFRMMF